MIPFVIMHIRKVKENNERDKHLDFAAELKTLCNMKVAVILIVINALGTISKGISCLNF